MKQQTLSDMEYGCRKKKTKWEEFQEIMDEIIPWDEWVGVIRPYYLAGKGETVILTESDIGEAALRSAIGATGYEVRAVSTEPYEKKGLFHR